MRPALFCYVNYGRIKVFKSDASVVFEVEKPLRGELYIKNYGRKGSIQACASVKIKVSETRSKILVIKNTDATALFRHVRP